MNLPGQKEEKEKRFGEVKQRINIILIRYFKGFIVFLVFIIFIFGYLLIIKPEYKEIIQVSKLNDEKNNFEYLEKKKELEKINSLLKLYKEVNPIDIKKINLALPEENISEELFSIFESIVLKNGLILTFLTTETEDQLIDKGKTIKKPDETITKDEETKDALTNEIGVVKIKLSIGGVDYSSLKNLLNSIENNLRLMDINKVDFAPGGNVAFEIDTYYLKQK
ncbi:MAG: hypothetical protein ABIE43_02870 [Patescibacteria group bacterium]